MPDSSCPSEFHIPPARSYSDPGTDRNRSFQPIRRKEANWNSIAGGNVGLVTQGSEGRVDAKYSLAASDGRDDAPDIPSHPLQLLASQHSHHSRLALTSQPNDTGLGKVDPARPALYYRSTSADIVVNLGNQNQGRVLSSNEQEMLSSAERQVSPSKLTDTADVLAQRMSDSPSNPFPQESLHKSGAQQIEAHLTNDDPAPNARSRKASHYLGLFKENVSPREHGTGGDPRGSRDGHRSRRSHQESSEYEFADKPSLDSLSANTSSNPNSNKSTLKERLYPIPKTHLTYNSTPKEAYDFEKGKELESTGIRTPANIAPLKESIEWRSSSPVGGSLPIRLLEQIRERRGMGNPWKGSKNDKDVQVAPKDVEDVNKKSRSSTTSSNTIAEDMLEPDKKTQKGGEDDTEYESDKEQIASATYFPHRGPSPDALTTRSSSRNRLSSHSLVQPEGLSDRLHTQVGFNNDRPVRPSRSATMTQSTIPNEPKYDRKTDGSADAASTTSEISQSDMDYESVENTSSSSQFLEPHRSSDAAPVPFSAEKSKSATSQRSPLGAVVLKPYKHQVGGHTKVFSFSRQAICKELNKRENVFYEVIEHSHPELLRFMPKYLGVLNVTYEKAPKRKKFPNGISADAELTSNFHPLPDAPATQLIQDPSASKNTEATLQASATDGSVRTISRSHHFDSADDAVPQVEYANNMHMIPMNLFQSADTRWTESLPPYMRGHNHPNSTSQNGDRQESSASPFSSDPKYRSLRPDLLQSPSWGATTVNTQFKDKVLREVFSPPVVHHRKRPGHSVRELALETAQLKSASPFGRTRNLSHQRSLTVEAGLKAPGLSREATDKVADEGKDQLGDKAPKSTVTDSSSASLPYRPLSGVESAIEPSESRVVSRRRSGGGLRRGQVDLDDRSRGPFKYYDYNEAEQNHLDDAVFPIDLTEGGSRDRKYSFTSEKEGVDPGSKNSESQSEEMDPCDRSTVALSTTPKASELLQDTGPTNPLQAQQQKDEHVRHFLLLEDLTANMSKPCVLDLKMGTRQYGIGASKQKQMSQRQKCRTTTSQELGVRVCGMQMWNASTKLYLFEDKYAGRDVKAGRDFQDTLTRFLYDGVSEASVVRHIPRLLEKLSKLEKIIQTLPGYRFYASSLLMLYDGDRPRSEQRSQAASPTCSTLNQTENPMGDGTTVSDIEIKLVDFANCVTREDELPESTPCPPKDRDGVDRGYLRGLRSLRAYLQRIWKDIEEGNWVERGEGEGMGIGMRGAGRSMDQPDGWQDDWENSGDVSV